MISKENEDMILIQGAGIAGLTLAALLQQKGQPYRLIDHVRVLRPVGAGLGLQANAQAILARLGFQSALAESGCWLSAMTLGPAQRPRRFAFDRGAKTLGVHRGQLHEALLSRVPTERLSLGVSVSRWHQGVQGVDVELSSGETQRVSHLIGADGIHSSLREQLGKRGDLRVSHQWCWRTVLPGQPLGESGFEVFAGRHRLGAFPVGPNRTYLYWVESGLARTPDNNARALRQLARFGATAAPLADCGSSDLTWLCHPLNDRPVYWGLGNVALIGDAAHPVTPNMGQGAALAMEDAWILSRLLSSRQEPAAPGLRRRRQRRVQSVRRLSWLAGRMAHLHWQPARWLRDQSYARLPATQLLHSQNRFVNHFIEEMDHV